jgi:hypothetical protein
MRRNVAEDAGQRTNFERLMIWYRDVVLAMFIGGQPHVAAGLSRDLVAKWAQSFCQVRPRQVSWQLHITQGPANDQPAMTSSRTK